MSSLVVVLASLSMSPRAADVPASNAPDPVGAFDYEPVHGLLYIPVEEVTLVPTWACPMPQGGDDAPGLGCAALVDEEVSFAPVADIETVVAGVAEALAPYGVIVTTTRPPFWVPYHMLIPRVDELPESSSATCAIAYVNCDGIDRNDIATTVAGTAACTDPDPVRAALVAFGVMSGLEGKANGADVMGYPPDFTATTTFVDGCDPIVTPEDPNTMMPVPPACPSIYHQTNGMCATDSHQNSHQELLAIYGPSRPADDTPPTIGEIGGLPDEGALLPAGSAVPVAASITDDSGVVAVRIALQSPALETEFGVADGLVDKCFGGACGVHAGGRVPAQPIEFPTGGGMAYPDPEQPWLFNELPALPDGEYVLTIEAADLSGNSAEPITRTFSIGRGTVGTSDEGGAETGADDGDGGAEGPSDGGGVGAETNASASDDGPFGTDESATDAPSANDEIVQRGCGCTSVADRASPWLFGIALRRRRRGSHG